MIRSQNGWPANDRSVISTRSVRGTHVRLAVRTGPAGDLLLEIAALYDLMIQDIDATADDWGYAERTIRGSATTVSNHASGTAIDLNATCWPLGSEPSVNLTARQIATVREIVAVAGGTVRWGGDYSGRKDPMHFEIADDTAEAECASALAALRAHYGDPHPIPQEDDLTPEQAAQLDRVHHELTTWLDNRRGPGGQTIPGGGMETLLGYSANADGGAFRLEAEVAYLHKKLDWLHENPPTPPAPPLDYRQLALALIEALGH